MSFGKQTSFFFLTQFYLNVPYFYLKVRYFLLITKQSSFPNQGSIPKLSIIKIYHHLSPKQHLVKVLQMHFQKQDSQKIIVYIFLKTYYTTNFVFHLCKSGALFKFISLPLLTMNLLYYILLVNNLPSICLLFHYLRELFSVTNCLPCTPKWFIGFRSQIHQANSTSNMFVLIFDIIREYGKKYMSYQDETLFNRLNAHIP